MESPSPMTSTAAQVYQLLGDESDVSDIKMEINIYHLCQLSRSLACQTQMTRCAWMMDGISYDVSIICPVTVMSDDDNM